MRDYFEALKIALYKQRFSLLSLIIACVGWVVIAGFVSGTFGQNYVDIFAYSIAGYYWLGGIVAPWLERKLEKLFDY